MDPTAIKWIITNLYTKFNNLDKVDKFEKYKLSNITQVETEFWII